ncbi:MULTISPECIES: hypothetical protein [Pseudomonas]|uniref:Lipoprotein n=1 Tax=Pseudomonas chlororaphis O6 TaxID=1037915 RepID=A0AB33X084_9PSED|nr:MULTISPECIES: hypothetical protein [Pseudomonas]EIM18794.1 hypothetical protein PchlO6_0011 [Pseudomonas chlororaphis O6]POA74153.1 hypothetical protein C1888_05785 [Pseudomonas sp. GW531-T4]PWY53343.1 hypothetical protein DK261_02340 [Pseudomonas sp. RW409]
MGNILGKGRLLYAGIAQAADLARFTTLMLAACLSLGSTAEQPALPSSDYALPVQRYFSPSVTTIGFSDSQGFAPIGAPQTQTAQPMVYQEQQRWVF